ncbi:MAG: zinc-ribbon domain-containing protein, partial [Lachnospiraceae bacterium]|nr:zinc-ribbon domain-containing protein [Lachnospiraceae bacterium]
MAKFCSNCGAPLEEGSRFCEKCGTPVEQSSGNGQSIPSGQVPHQPNGQGGPQYGQAPQYGQDPQYGQAPQYGQGPQYGQAPQYGQGPQYGQAPQYPPNPNKGPKTGLIVGIIAAAAVAVVLIVLFVTPVGRNLLAKKDNNTSASVSTTSGQQEGRASSQASSRASSSQARSEASSERASSSQARSEASSAKTSSSTTSSAPASSAKPDETDLSSLSTTEVPQFVDFLWFTEDVYYNGAPAAKKDQKDYSALLGSWKALAFIDPENKMDSRCYDYSTYTFEGTASFAILKTQRHSMYLFDGGTSVDTSGEGMSTWHGAFDNGTIKFDGPGAISIDLIYTYNGREYALGHYYYPSGENGPLALVRP